MSPRSFDKLRMSGGRHARDERDAVCDKEPQGLPQPPPPRVPPASAERDQRR